MGCPVRKFPPINEAAYMEDTPVPPPARASGNCHGCGEFDPADLPLTFGEVTKHFAKAVSTWIAEGLPLVDAKVHGARYAACRGCIHFKNYQCKLCRCIVYIKAKLATAECPKQLWLAITNEPSTTNRDDAP